MEAFCQELKTTRTFKSYKNDFSRLRVFFGPVCESLMPGVPGAALGTRPTTHGHDKYADKHIRAALLEDVTPEVINRFLAARIQQDGWSAKTANLMRQTLHKLFSYAIKHHSFHSRDPRYPNPVKAVDKKKEPAPQIRFLRSEEIRYQLELLAESPVIRALVATYIYAGLRREEALWLTQEDVDLSQRLIRVRAKTVGEQKWQPKTKRNRVVPISDALHVILSEYTPPADGPWFFPSPAGKRWDPDNFSQDLRATNETAGLAWSCLDFRHTFGSHLAQKGVSLYKIATLMGNSPEICRRHYAALIPEEMRDVVEFDAEEKQTSSGDETKKMLQEILAELRGNKQAGTQSPNLKLIRINESA
ncbi:MAG TPA: tyrosine-type recombinase/integrase [Sedimentisphaerales bacterium]|nr:tyrosine-type recombinase/integrase [Sedimentisphaerales bacterium]